MPQTRPIHSLTVPLGGQAIELQEISFDTGGMPFLRLRIREGKRFTVLDLDPATVLTLAQAMGGWAAKNAECEPVKPRADRG